MRDHQGVDLSDPRFLTDPYPFYQRLQATGGPSRSESGNDAWLFSRYDDALAVLKEARTSTDLRRVAPEIGSSPINQTMVHKDPPDHSRIRSLTTRAFTPQRIRDLEPRVERITAGLIAGMKRRRHFDFISEFALPLPATVIAELLGVPGKDHERFGEWSLHIVMSLDDMSPGPEEYREGGRALASLTDYLIGLLRNRRKAPKDDLLSALLAAHDQGDRLTEDELLGTCILLLTAGHLTTVQLLGNGMLSLLRHPEQLEWLRGHPEGIPCAVEEMLRYESPIQRAFFRVATDQFTVGGVSIEGGQLLNVMIGAANRDPAHFDQPDRFDIHREPNRHLAFGAGIHACLGAGLARAESRIAFQQLLESLPGLSLTTAPPDWLPNTVLRALRSLPMST